MLPSLLLFACTPAQISVADKSEDSDGPVIGDTALVDTGETGEPVDTGPVIEYDCAALPAIPVEDNELVEPRAYHDVAFDESGRIIGWDGRASLTRTTYDGDFEIFSPGFNSVQGMDRLRDGTYVVGDDASQNLWRVADDGTKTVLAGGIGPVYGVMVGPDGNIYYASNMSVFRVAPDTGANEELLTFDRWETPRAVTFSLDNATMYIATIGRGRVYSVPLDASLTPTGEPTVFASGVGDSWHDGIGIDACGNLYVPEYATAGLYKITPEGTVTPVYAGRLTPYGHGIEWGSGYGGWRADAIYLPQPYDRNTVREIVLGVPSGNLVRDTW